MKKILFSLSWIVIVITSSAQEETHLISGSFTEKTIANVMISKVVSGKFLQIAEYTISPENSDFLFAIPKEPGVTYRLQANVYKPGPKRPKLDKISSFLLPVNPQQSYTLKITPSKLDTARKRGWVLTKSETRLPVSIMAGKIANLTNAVPLTLYSVVDGDLASTSSFSTAHNGDFVIPVSVKKAGFYYLESPRWRTRIYLAPSEKLALNINNLTGAIESVKGSPVNQLLMQWQHLISPITRYGYNLVDFDADTIKIDTYIAEYKKLQPRMEEFISSWDLTDAAAVKAVTFAMETDRELAPLKLLYHLSDQASNPYKPYAKDFGKVPSFYNQFMQPSKLTDASVLLLGEARQFMMLYAKLNVALLSGEERHKLSNGEKLAKMMNVISNDTLKSFFLQDQMTEMDVNNLSEFRTTFEPFKQYAKEGVAKKTYESIFNLFSADTAYLGKSSYNFTLPDTSGKMVSMKDFKGKVVFIDVWATWCGPCKAQIPFLKQIEEEYKDNKDIVFMGISVDYAKDRQKWVDFIRKENLVGIQVIDEGWTHFAKKYKIDAIPRFMLIDKHGNWIEIRCPRPESKETLKRYLDKALAE